MVVKASVEINGTREAIWKAIIDLDNATDTIGGIDKIEILERPDQGLVGLKWKETRTLMGKESTEVMWVTEAVENKYFTARAESHGSVYLCTKRIDESGGKCNLAMIHETKPQTIATKMMTPLLGLLFKSTFRKLIMQDLSDIKQLVEADEDS